MHLSLRARANSVESDPSRPARSRHPVPEAQGRRAQGLGQPTGVFIETHVEVFREYYTDAMPAACERNTGLYPKSVQCPPKCEDDDATH